VAKQQNYMCTENAMCNNDKQYSLVRFYEQMLISKDRSRRHNCLLQFKIKMGGIKSEH